MGNVNLWSPKNIAFTVRNNNFNYEMKSYYKDHRKKG